jgi:hypothetical protein
MNNLEKDFIKTIHESYKLMLSQDNGTRSTNKIKLIHNFVANAIQSKLTNDYKIYSISTKERKVRGRYYDKDVDIAITYKEHDIGGISIKFVTGNYKQNANNYFEHLLGETANLRTNQYRYASFNIFPKYLPYYKKDKTLSKIEEINTYDLIKYFKLSKEENFYHKPDMFFLSIIDTGTKEFLQKNIGNKIERKGLLSIFNISKYDYKNSSDFDNNIKQFIKNHSNIKNFIEAFVNLIKSSSYGKD